MHIEGVQTFYPEQNIETHLAIPRLVSQRAAAFAVECREIAY
jgi:hypothetical protein